MRLGLQHPARAAATNAARPARQAAGSVPVLRARGRLWRGVELMCGEMRWPQDYHALIISAALDPRGVGLLDPAAWQASDSQQFSR